MNQIALYCPMADDREEREELRMLRERTREQAELRRAMAEEQAEARRMEAVEAENRAMKQRARRAKREKAAREAGQHQRSLGYLIGACAGILAVVAWSFTKDIGITAAPIALGAWLLRRK